MMFNENLHSLPYSSIAYVYFLFLFGFMRSHSRQFYLTENKKNFVSGFVWSSYMLQWIQWSCCFMGNRLLDRNWMVMEVLWTTTISNPFQFLHYSCTKVYILHYSTKYCNMILHEKDQQICAKDKWMLRNSWQTSRHSSFCYSKICYRSNNLNYWVV